VRWRLSLENNLTNGGNSFRFVHLLLLTAERAYAHAMCMKASGTEDNAGFPGSTRHHIVSRLNKASKVAEQLADLVSSSSVTGASDTNVLEARAYAYSLSGAEQFEKHASGQRSGDKEAQREKWQDCLVSYSTARVIYAALLKSTKKDMYKELLAGTVDPSIRFAAYQSHIPRTTAVVTISRNFFPEDQEDLVESVTAIDSSAFEDAKSASGETTGAANIPNTITWRGRKANIVDASIGQALAAVSSAEEHLIATLDAEDDDSAKDKAAAYDEVLIAAQDAADATRHAIEEHEKEKIPEADPRMQDLRVTNLAVNYDLIGWRVGRNRVLIGDDDGAALEGSAQKKPKRPRTDGKEWVGKAEGNGRILARLRERVVLYDAILQSIDSVKELPGAVRDAAFVEELDGKRAYFQALK
jgi:signal recognition particle subunit SRP68